MFNVEALKYLEPVYFNIIIADAYDVTSISRSTGHYWHIHSTKRARACACVIFHKHTFSHPYYYLGSSNGLKQTIQSIQSHDYWQMNGKNDVKLNKTL